MLLPPLPAEAAVESAAHWPLLPLGESLTALLLAHRLRLGCPNNRRGSVASRNGKALPDYLLGSLP